MNSSLWFSVICKSASNACSRNHHRRAATPADSKKRHAPFLAAHPYLKHFNFSCPSARYQNSKGINKTPAILLFLLFRPLIRYAGKKSEGMIKT